MMLKIIDSHVHFWNPGHLRYAWLDDLPTLNRTFLAEDVPRSVENRTIEGLIFVQADCAAEQALQETTWISSLAARDERIQGIVAFAPLEQGEAVRPALEQLKAYPLVKGVRRLIQFEEAGFSTQPAFIAGVKLLVEYDLSFDICIRHHQLREVITLVEHCPEVQFVLDHAGKPDIKAGLLIPWQEHIQTLAQFPNVMCKISGLVTEADAARWSLDDLRPYMDRVLEVFGVERVMFGSDYPVVTLAANYDTWLNMFLIGVARLPHQDIVRLVYDNAKAFYRT